MSQVNLNQQYEKYYYNDDKMIYVYVVYVVFMSVFLVISNYLSLSLLSLCLCYGLVPEAEALIDWLTDD